MDTALMRMGGDTFITEPIERCAGDLRPGDGTQMHADPLPGSTGACVDLYPLFYGGQMFTFEPIGMIHSPFTDPAQTPIQPFRSHAEGVVELWPQYAPGLREIEGFSHLLLFYVFHHAAPGYELTVAPFLDDQPKGLFATRYPRRPNNLGLSMVRLLAVEENRLRVGGIDVLDGTPLLDLKPHIPHFDCADNATIGWLEGRL